MATEQGRGLSDEFAEHADGTAEWAAVTLPAAVEAWDAIEGRVQSRCEQCNEEPWDGWCPRCNPDAPYEPSKTAPARVQP